MERPASRFGCPSISRCAAFSLFCSSLGNAKIIRTASMLRVALTIAVVFLCSAATAVPLFTYGKWIRVQSLVLTLRRALGGDCSHGETAAHSIRWRALLCDERREAIFHGGADRVGFLRPNSQEHSRCLSLPGLRHRCDLT
jgi:hypothetical protein